MAGAWEIVELQSGWLTSNLHLHYYILTYLCTLSIDSK